MIHHSCDCCGKRIDPEQQLRYVLRMEVYAALDPLDVDGDPDDRDHLEDLQEILEGLDDPMSEESGDDIYRQLRFDLCPDCARRFVKDPLRREPLKLFGFSAN